MAAKSMSKQSSLYILAHPKDAWLAENTHYIYFAILGYSLQKHKPWLNLHDLCYHDDHGAIAC